MRLTMGMEGDHWSTWKQWRIPSKSGKSTARHFRQWQFDNLHSPRLHNSRTCRLKIHSKTHLSILFLPPRPISSFFPLGLQIAEQTSLVGVRGPKICQFIADLVRKTTPRSSITPAHLPSFSWFLTPLFSIFAFAICRTRGAFNSARHFSQKGFVLLHACKQHWSRTCGIRAYRAEYSRAVVSFSASYANYILALDWTHFLYA